MIVETPHQHWAVKDLDLIVPVYKNRALTERCLRSIVENLDEIAAHSPRIIVVNDSPFDDETTQMLRTAEKAGDIHLLIENEENLGFVKSVNRALDESCERGASAVLINSDTVTFPGTLAEMVRVANTDEQFAFVCPRSNNASLCTFPRPPHAQSGTTMQPEECFESWKALADYLPPYSYAPTAIGFYMLIKGVIIKNFHGLDARFGAGYEEENDLVMRAGKVGFRAVLANHAYAYHFGSASFSLTDLELDDHRLKNLQELKKIHPEFIPLVRRFEHSAAHQAERILRGLIPDSKGKLDIAFVLISMGAFFNGTNEFIVNVLKAFCTLPSSRFNVTLICSQTVAEFHGLDELPGVRIRSEIDQVYAIAFSFGQPYDLHILNIMERAAPINVFSMLDVISLDCSSLRESQRVEELWESVALFANGVVSISEFSKRTFEHRFPDNDAKIFAQLLPTKLEAYSERYALASHGRRHVYVAGNHFSHKDSTRTGKFLANQFPSLAFMVLGQEGGFPENAKVLSSGRVSDDAMIDALANASVIVLPSYYEGFGFTLMHALALKKPIVLRDIPVTREILGTFSKREGIFLYGDDEELKTQLERAIATERSDIGQSSGMDWTEWATGLQDFLAELPVDRATVYAKLVQRLKLLDLTRSKILLRDLQDKASKAEANSELSRAKAEIALPELLKAEPDDFVSMLYEKVLGREADTTGRLAYLEQLSVGADRAKLLMSILKSEEYRNSGRRVAVRGAYGLSAVKFWLVGRGLM